MNFLCVSVFLLRPCHNTKPQREQSSVHSNASWLLLILLQSNDSTQCKVAEQVRQYCIMSIEGPQSVSYYPALPLFPIETAKIGYCPKSWPVLFTIITLKSDSWFRSTGDFCGRLYRSGVLMSSSGAVANGVVSGVRSKRPRWDYHSQGDWERFCQPKPSGCKRHTSEVKVNYQMNSQAFSSLSLTSPYCTLLLQ